MHNATLSYIISRCHERHMDDREPKWRDRALAIEFWIATAVVGGHLSLGRGELSNIGASATGNIALKRTQKCLDGTLRGHTLELTRPSSATASSRHVLRYKQVARAEDKVSNGRRYLHEAKNGSPLREGFLFNTPSASGTSVELPCPMRHLCASIWSWPSESGTPKIRPSTAGVDKRAKKRTLQEQIV